MKKPNEEMDLTSADMVTMGLFIAFASVFVTAVVKALA